MGGRREVGRERRWCKCLDGGGIIGCVVHINGSLFAGVLVLALDGDNFKFFPLSPVLLLLVSLAFSG